MRLWAIGLLCLAVGCASTGFTGAGANDALLRVIGGGDFGFSLDGGHVLGPKVDLTLGPDSIRGVLGASLVRLQVEDNKVFGAAGVGNVSLTAEEDGPTLIVRGLYGPIKLQLRISSDKIDGTVMRNWYLERAADGVFRGSGAEFKMAPSIQKRLQDLRLAAVLVLALTNLGQEGISVPGPPGH